MKLKSASREKVDEKGMLKEVLIKWDGLTITVWVAASLFLMHPKVHINKITLILFNSQQKIQDAK